MKIYLIKKEKGRVYQSEEIVKALFGLELEHDEDGAPRIAGGGRFISITDTRNYWACAIEDHPIGIDMEEAGRTVRPDIVKRFHKDEQAYLAVLSEGSREWTDEFLSIWTRKEAYSKLRGKGLRLGFSRFSVLAGPASPADAAESSPQAAPVELASFAYKNLVFGIAGACAAEVIPSGYDAPMEQSALDFAAGLLDARAYTSAALKEKLLARGYGREESEDAVEKLKSYGYINDKAYAEELARRAAESGKGSRRISYELREKGVDKELASEASAEYKEDDLSRALETARKTIERSSPSSDRRRLAGKVSRKLSALGYDASVIYSVLEDLGLW